VTQPDIKALEAKLEQNRKNYPHAQIDPDIALAAELYLQSLKAGNKQIMSADEFVLWAVKNGYGDFIKTSTRL
jgi:hypothetical protein